MARPARDLVHADLRAGRFAARASIGQDAAHMGAVGRCLCLEPADGGLRRRVELRLVLSDPAGRGRWRGQLRARVQLDDRRHVPVATARPCARSLHAWPAARPIGQLRAGRLPGPALRLAYAVLYRGGAGFGDRAAGVDPARADSRFPRGLQGGRHGADRPALSAHPDVPDALVDHFLRRYSQFRRLRNGHLPSLADDPLP